MNKVRVIAFSVLFLVLLPNYGYTQSEGLRGKVFWGGGTIGGAFFEHDADRVGLSGYLLLIVFNKHTAGTTKKRA